VKIVPEPVLAGRTTLRLGGTALAEIILEKQEDVRELPDQLHRLGGRALALGGGSNILARDGALPLVLVRLRHTAPPRMLGQDQTGVRLRVAGAMRLPRLLGWCAGHGYAGLEKWAGIPGTLGGAVAMNAGSHGTEMAHILERVLLWTPIHGCVWQQREQWKAGYRWFDSGLKPAGNTPSDSGLELILAAELRLRPDTPDVIRERMRDWYGRKKATQPITKASAGCVFKNPDPGHPAGRLLEQAGLRGYSLGKMQFSEQHANFLVNHGGGQADQALELMDLARRRVLEQSGLELQPEVRIVA
jgi:UDP-N-acetylmuramate dehydrogenase